MRSISAVIEVQDGRRPSFTSEFPIIATEIQAYDVSTSLDTDADTFSLDIGDPTAKYASMLERDTEIRVNIYTKGYEVEALHAGIADEVSFDSDDTVLSITGRDFSSVPADTDAVPARYHHLNVGRFIASQASKYGIANTRIASMSEIATVVQDGTEKEWQFWYRLAREKNMWLWFESGGTLIGDKLNYSTKPTYFFGKAANGTRPENWIPIQKIEVRKSTRGRKGEVWVYFENAKTKQTYFAKAVDTSIRAWKRRPLEVLTLTTAKDQADVQKRADDEMHDSIVAANEIEVTIPDPGFLVRQNYMAQINIPELDFSGVWFVTGVHYQGGPDGYVQIVRLREGGFALDQVVPEAPVLKPDAGDKKIVGSIDTAIGQAGIPWGRGFERATSDYHNGWDYALFLGVLFAIARQESGSESFPNIRESHSGALNDIQWFKKPTSASVPLPPGFPQGLHSPSLEERITLWRQAFANSAGNVFNPFHGERGNAEAGVGPMQITSVGIKEDADGFGWADHPFTVDPPASSEGNELSGGRWNPYSSIRAAAKYFRQMLEATHADPNKPETIWWGVAAYHTGPGNWQSSSGSDYAKSVKKYFDDVYEIAAASILAESTQQPAGTDISTPLPDGTTVKMPADTPDVIKKAINWAIGMIGDPYQYGGSGPHYDCSSFVTYAYKAGGYPSGSLGQQGALDYHGHDEDTYSLWKPGRFVSVPKDNLLPGDLVFFNDQAHMGMIIDDVTNRFIQDPHTGDSVKVSGLNDGWYAENYDGARRLVDWNQISIGPQPHEGKIQRVLIQAGHADPKEPGFPEEGATGEKEFNIAVRDRIVAKLQGDPRFKVTSAPGDIPDDWVGELALYIHADGNEDPSVNGYSFGYGNAQDQQASIKYKTAISVHYETIPGHPTHHADNYTDDEAFYYGFHKTDATAELLMEHGFRTNGAEQRWMDSHLDDIAIAHYLAICDYFSYNPIGT